jgi:5-oxoprolinase (ATP-hydrolysing)
VYVIGIDVGGTFTDFVVAQEGQPPRYFKTASTPNDPSEGLMTGLGDAAAAHDLSLEDFLAAADMIIHGSTVATNTLVERKGAKVGLITTDGFRDLLEMREGLKEDRYNLRMTPVVPLVPRYLRAEVPERVKSDGSVKVALDEDALNAALDSLKDEGVEALAVCFLFSYLNSDHEDRVGEIIEAKFPGMYTSLSSQVIPQIKEFDRLSTTVINSYVGPVLGRYLENLQERLTQINPSGQHSADFLIMQSNGGVAPIEDSRRLAVRSILSGPAGGVSGAAAYGRLSGSNDIIAFDMGGTSTDISLIENGEPHLSTEKFEAGWKISVPMIDIHTMGAGGGSIASVGPGGIMQVGPESAGAMPGPAAYGKGGEKPTVTDANLALGYLDAGNFLGGSTVLDKSLAEEAIAEHVAQATGLSMIEAAEGISEVVSTSIAEGVRLMSVQRGVDPRRFTMMAFGGAAGLQAGKVARQLQVERVIIPAAAAVLSAHGMLSTDLKYDYSRSQPAALLSMNLDAVKNVVAGMETEGRQKLLGQGVPEEKIEVTISADMRYLDQIYEVNVPIPNLAQGAETLLNQWAENFHQRYRELYSYSQSEQEIRLVTLRVSVVGRLPKLDPPPLETGSGLPPKPKANRQIYLGGWTDAPVYEISDLSPGSTVDGPAVLESDFTTVLVETGDKATIDPYGGIELQVSLNTAGAAAAVTDRPDPVTLAVVEHRLESIAREMTEVMLRTAMSQILNSSRDFSTAILDADCQLVAQGEGIPVHVSALPVAGAAVRDYFGDTISEGDLFILNDPYFGGSHLPDITIIKPVFHDGKLLFYGVNRAHHSDVGGGTHGGYNPRATEIYQEGIRIPPLKLYDKGVPREDVLQMLAANVRQPENFLGDLNAQIGSTMIAAQRIAELLESYGSERLLASVEEILSATERQVRQFISEWPDGVYYGESLVDDDGFDSKLIPIRAKVTISGDSMAIDLGESSKQVTGFINSAYANTRSLAHAAIMYVAPSNVAKNEGSMRPVDIIAPKGLIVNANPPAPVCMSTNHCAEEIVEAIFKALSQAVPKEVNAGFSRRLRYAITGKDPRTGRQFIWHFFLARGGGGATYGYDGWPGVGEINVAGGIRSPSIEVTEERFPFFIRRHEIRPNSGGQGEWRGGVGGICDLVYEGEGPALLNTAGDGIVVPPFGLFDGQNGLPHDYKIISNGVDRPLGSKETEVVVNPGDHVYCLSSGGGGYGNPSDRSKEADAWDKLNGYVG